MIRLIQRRLIIPRGDTGTFTIPVLGTADESSIAVFSIYDPLTRKTVCEKNFQLASDEDTLTIALAYEDTIDLEPKKYLWDIKVYRGGIEYAEGDEELPLEKKHITRADSINSYYAAFRLPICEIREVAKDNVL